MREPTFKHFDPALACTNQIALGAKKRDHHAEWSDVHDEVGMTLTSHDAGGLTGKDLELACVVDEADATKA